MLVSVYTLAVSNGQCYRTCLTSTMPILHSSPMGPMM